MGRQGQGDRDMGCWASDEWGPMMTGQPMAMQDEMSVWTTAMARVGGERARQEMGVGSR